MGKSRNIILNKYILFYFKSFITQYKNTFQIQCIRGAPE